MNGPGLYKAARRTLKIHETGASGDVLFSLNKPLKGACCTQNQCLPDKTETECLSLSGSWKGAGSNCGTNPCGFGPGACCVCNGDCYAINDAECDRIFSNFQHPILTKGQDITVQGGVYYESSQCGIKSCAELGVGDCDYQGLVGQ